MATSLSQNLVPNLISDVLKLLTLLGTPETTSIPVVSKIITASVKLALNLSNENEIYRGYIVAPGREFLYENMVMARDSHGNTNIVLMCTFPGLYKRIDTKKLLALEKAEVVLVGVSGDASLS